MVQVPIWNWSEGRYEINASKTATAIARMELADLREKISLQVEQSRFKVKEAQKKVAMRATQESIIFFIILRF
jgi:outer membrane protein TolC